MQPGLRVASDDGLTQVKTRRIELAGLTWGLAVCGQWGTFKDRETGASRIGVGIATFPSEAFTTIPFQPGRVWVFQGKMSHCTQPQRDGKTRLPVRRVFCISEACW